MNFTREQHLLGEHPARLAIVVALHVALGWALIHGMTRNAPPIKPPTMIDIVEAPKTPQEPPPPLPQPNTVKPDMPFVPVPFVTPTAEPDRTITAEPRDVPPLPSQTGSTTDEGPTSVSIAPPTQPRVVAKPAIANVQSCAPQADDYPAAARRAEATGVTRLRFTIDASGALARTDIVKSAGSSREHRMLDNAAASKLAGCVFTPGIDETGRATGGTFDVDYVWKLQ